MRKIFKIHRIENESDLMNIKIKQKGKTINYNTIKNFSKYNYYGNKCPDFILYYLKWGRGYFWKNVKI